MNYTPGPWRRHRDRTGRVSKIEGRGRRVCTFQPSDSNTEANASLIAAAPELLEALNRLEFQSELSLESADPARVAARKAIAKASGEK